LIEQITTGYNTGVEEIEIRICQRANNGCEWLFEPFTQFRYFTRLLPIRHLYTAETEKPFPDLPKQNKISYI
jgi:hypothetical protein